MSHWTTWCCLSLFSPYKRTQNLISRTSSHTDEQTGAETQSHNVNRWDTGMEEGDVVHGSLPHKLVRKGKLHKDIPTLGDRGCGFSIWTDFHILYKHTIVYLDIHKPKPTRVNCCVNAAVSALCLLLEGPQRTTSITAYILWSASGSPTSTSTAAQYHWCCQTSDVSLLTALFVKSYCALRFFNTC